MLQSVDEVGSESRNFSDKLSLRRPLYQFFEHDVDLHPRQVRAEAVVLPGATSSNASRALSSCRAFRPAGMTRRTYLDRADPCQRRTFGESDRLVEVAHVDQHEATELFLGLGEGAIGG